MAAAILEEAEFLQNDRWPGKAWHYERQVTGRRDHRVFSVSATLKGGPWVDMNIGNDRQAA